MHVTTHVPMWIYECHTHGGACGGRRGTSDSLRTQVIGTGNVTQILYTSAKFSLLLCHLSSPYFHTLINSYYICVLFSCAYAHVTECCACMEVKGQTEELILSSHHVYPRDYAQEWWGLAAGTLTYGVILLALVPSDSNTGPEVLWRLGS